MAPHLCIECGDPCDCGESSMECIRCSDCDYTTININRHREYDANDHYDDDTDDEC